jgi:hypothetical protein
VSGIKINIQQWLLPLATVVGVFLLLAAYSIAGNLEWYFVAGMAVYVAILFVVTEYLQSRGKHRIDKLYDERQARCMTLAARNGYMFALIALGGTGVAYSVGYDSMGLLGTLSILYALIVAVQFLSYLYYLGRDLV